MPTAHRMLTTISLLASASLLTALAACGSNTPDNDSAQAPPGYPRTIDNCGRSLTVESPPRRAVSLTQDMTEIMLSLGLADRMVGTATWTDPVLKHLAEANSTVPRLAENEPSFERVLAEEPDYVAAAFESTYERVGSRAKFGRLGVPAYLAPTDCVHKSNSGDGDGARTEPLRMRTVYREIREIATAFDVTEQGEKLIAGLRHRLREAAEGIDASGVSMLYWFANSESPYLAGCCGAPGIITRELGATNAFDDTHQEWPQINWETVANRDPDVLVLGDLTRDRQTAESGKSKIRFLESNPVTKHMDAVRNKRYVLLSGAAMNPSIRTVGGIEKVAAKLREFGLAN